MECKYCHADIPDSARFCPECGKPTAEAAPETETEAVETPVTEEVADTVTDETPASETEEVEETAEKPEEPAAEPVPNAPRHKTSPWKIVVAAVLVVALIGSIFAIIIACRSSQPSADATTPTDSTNSTDSTTATVDLTKFPHYTVADNKAAETANVVVGQIADDAITNGQFQVYYWMGVYNFLNYYGNYISYLGLDYTKPLDEQVQASGEETWQQYFVEAAFDNWHRYEALSLLAKQNGMTLGEELQTQLDSVPENMKKNAQENGYDSAEAMLQKEVGAGVTMDDYLYYLERYYLGYQYFESVYNTLTATDEEIDAYYTENSDTFVSQGLDREGEKKIDVRHILIQPENGVKDDDGNTTYSEEDWEAARVKAQQILDDWLAGEATEDTFAEAAAANSVDSSASNGGLYSNVSQGDMTDEFDAWCFDDSRQTGDYGLVRTKYGYHVMFFSGLSWYNTAKSALLSQKSNDFVDNAIEQFEMTYDLDKLAIAAVQLGNATE